MLRISALIGSTTLPVSRNSSTNMMTAIRPNTNGSREMIASTLSRFVCASPPNSTTRPSGVGTECIRLSWVSEASENNGSALPTVNNVLPDTSPVAVSGGPVKEPATKVPLGADTEFTSGIRDRSAAYRSTAARPSPTESIITIGTSESESMAKSDRNRSPTWCAEADFGSTRSSGKPGRTPRNGAPRTHSRTTTATPIGTARRITNFVERYQNCCSIGNVAGAGRPSIRRIATRTSRESRRSPSIMMAAGVMTMADIAAKATVATPA